MSDAPAQLVDMAPMPGPRLTTADLSANWNLYSTLKIENSELTTTGNWPVSNTAVLIPFVVQFPITIVRAIYIGANQGVGGANIDIGVYTFDGATKIVSTGSKAGVNGFASETLTSTTLSPGVYWMAMASSNSAATYVGSTASGLALRGIGVRSMASAMALPASLTFANAVNFVPYFGFSIFTTN